MKNVILLPHYASYSDEGDLLHRQRVGHLALKAPSGGLPERKVIINKSLYDSPKKPCQRESQSSD